MAFGNKIIVTPEPRGRFGEIIVVGTPKPGTMMELLSATAPVGGNPTAAGTYSMDPAGTTAASGSRGMNADGDRIPVCVLLCYLDHAACPPGRLATEAYVTGERGAVYYPQPGDQINILYQNQSGTADDVAVGDKGIIDDGTGKVLVSTGTVESEPWNFEEVLTDPAADALLLATYTGM